MTSTLLPTTVVGSYPQPDTSAVVADRIRAAFPAHRAAMLFLRGPAGVPVAGTQRTASGIRIATSIAAFADRAGKFPGLPHDQRQLKR
jgi:hypothetical protein